MDYRLFSSRVVQPFVKYLPLVFLGTILVAGCDGSTGVVTEDNTLTANQPDEQTAVTEQLETTEQIDPPDPSEQGGNNSGQSSVDTENSVDNENTDPTSESEVILVGVFAVFITGAAE